MTREEADKLIEAINAQVDEPKVEKWIPKREDLIEVSDSEEFHDFPIIAKFHSVNDKGKVVVSILGQKGSSWSHYRKLRTKATRHEWSGGECPVERDQLVAIECKDGGKNITKAGYFRWEYHDSESDIVAYWELES